MTTFSHTFLIMVKTMTYKNKLSHTLVNKMIMEVKTLLLARTTVSIDTISMNTSFLLVTMQLSLTNY